MMLPIKIPEFCTLPIGFKCSPHLEAVSHAMWEWIDHIGLAPTPRAHNRMLHSGVDLSGAYAWPQVDAATLLLGVKWLAFAFRLDDQLDEDDSKQRWDARVAAITHLCAILHESETKYNSLMGKALLNLWRETSYSQPEAWRSAFRADFESFLDAYAQEAKLDSTATPIDLDQYFETRIHSVGQLWMATFGELGLSGFLPDRIRSCSTFHRLRRSAALYVALVNDIYSAPCEQSVGYRHNAVLITLHRDGCDLQEAVDVVADMVADMARSFTDESITLEAESRFLSLSDRVVIREYIDFLGEMIQGQVAWHSKVQRYAIDDPDYGTGRNPNYPDDLLG